jgi:acyl-CoA reductase-like NAD-dependent aldehyde dehydrogenase
VTLQLFIVSQTQVLTRYIVNGKTITAVSIASATDVDIAVAAAKQAYKTSWGFKVPGPQRGRMLAKLADLRPPSVEYFEEAWDGRWGILPS